MEKRLNFETFLVNYGDQFHNYLSEKSCDWEKYMCKAVPIALHI